MERFNQPIKLFFKFFSPEKKGAPIILEEKLNPFEQKQFSSLRIISLASLLIVLVIMGLFITYSSSKFLPETYLEEVRIGGLNKVEALQKIAKQYPSPPEHNIILSINTEENYQDLENFEHLDVVEATSSVYLESYYQPEEKLSEILKQQQSNPLNWVIQLFFAPYKPENHSLPVKYSEEKISNYIEEFKNKVDKPSNPPRASLGYSNSPKSLVLNTGKNILGVDQEKTKQKLTNFLNENSTLSNLKKENKDFLKINSETKWLSQTLSEDEKNAALEVANKLVGKEIIFTYDVINKKLNDQKLISFLTFPSGFIEENLDEQLNAWKKDLDRPAQNAEFEFDRETFRVKTFIPHREGLILDENETKKIIKETILEIVEQEKENNTFQKNLNLITSSPNIPLSETNNLGINERIGFGESYYYHSIPTRIHNVALTANRINYSIVAPGKEFSFNRALGDVSSATGYRPAYVIKDGATVLGDGGGVCQVSTTLFRSLLDSGLNITLRLPHSYRVSYYELDKKPGFDATVYDGNVDLRFINDTENYILIYTETDSSNLYMKVEIYGTSDGRTTEITDHKTWGYSDPLPPVYVPDQSLAPGQLKQIDWAASGIKAQFKHTVKDKNGEIIREKTYYSNYRPWAAKYLQGI